MKVSNEVQGNVHINVGEQRILFKHEIIGKIAAEKICNDGKLLDLGCGLGQTLEVVRKHNQSVSFSIADAYQVCLDMTGERVNIEETFLIDEESFDLTGIENNSYDLVMLSHVLEHLRDPIKALSSLMQKVKPGGIAIVVVPNTVRPEVFAFAMLRKHYVNRGHVYSWDRSHWMNFLEKINGLNVESYEPDFIRFPLHTAWPFKPFSKWLAKVFPFLSNGNIAIIRKPL